MIDELPRDMAPPNWLVILGHPQGKLTLPFKPAMSEQAVLKMRDEFNKWNRRARLITAGKDNRTVMSLVGLKKLAESLPRTINVRNLILAEPDQLPFEQGIAKVEVFLRLLHQELGRPS